MAPKHVGDDTQQVTVRLDGVTLKRLEKIAEELSSVGTPFGRSDALRAVISRGLDILETALKNKKPVPGFKISPAYIEREIAQASRTGASSSEGLAKALAKLKKK